jgi:PKD repeat protein
MGRRAVILVVGLLLVCAAPVIAQSPYIYGIHDHDPNPQEYLNRIEVGGASGWVTATVAIGSDPNDHGGGDFSFLADRGHTVIVRLNNGYCPNGTIPEPARYEDFARRAANYVAASSGANIWVIGNETNLAGEWPLVDGRLRYVSPQNYATLFRKVYDAIKAVGPDHQVVPQALAPFAGPYNPGSTCGYPHDGNPLNWVQYMNRMLTAIKSTGGLDGIAVHINSRGYSYADIHSTQRVSAGGQDLFFSFYVYKDWVDHGIPADLYHLPIYATESNGIHYWSGNHPEDPGSHYEAGWMQEIYAEIDRYNLTAAVTGKPIYRCVNMYRWCGWCDGWNIDSSPYEGQILTDLEQAVAAGYTWPDGSNPPPPPPPGPTGDNLARDAVAWSASSSYNGDYGGDKAYDDIVSASSKWTSDGSGASSWLALDLGSEADLNGFIVRHAGDGGEQPYYNTETFRVEMGNSLDGPWTVLSSIDNSQQDDSSTVVLATNATTRFVRLFITDAGIDSYARIPEFEVYGSQTAPPPPPPPPPPASGPLVNGGFEEGELSDGAGGGWTAYASSGYDAVFEVVNDVVAEGSHAQRVLSPQPSSNDQFAGIHQMVSTTPGETYTVRASNRTYFPGGHAWDHIARLGIDHSGGTDARSDSVEWFEFDSAKNVWHQLEFETTATGATMTVFLESWRKWASGGASWAWFDGVAVEGAGEPPPQNHLPTAVGTAQPTSGETPLTVNFDGSGSTDPDGDSLTSSWDFGDGESGSGVGPSHTYVGAGIYTATLTIDDGRGGNDSATVTITVTAPEPPPVGGDALTNGDFEGASQADGVGEGWTAFSTDGYGASFEIVLDQVHGGAAAQRVLSPQPPGNDRYAGVFQTVDASPGADATIRAWSRTSFAGGHAWDHIARLGVDCAGGTDHTSGSVEWFEFDSAKDAWHQLEVEVTAQASSITVFLQSWRKWASGGDSITWFDDVEVITGVNQPPSAEFSAAPSVGDAPLTVSFDGSASSDPDGDLLSFAWQFGDGGQGSGVVMTHTYASPGTYNASLTVSDGSGGVDSASVAITVEDGGPPPPGNNSPIAEATSSSSAGEAPVALSFDGSGSYDPDGDALSYTWDFGDGNQATGINVSHTYQFVGSYKATLIVSDGLGGTATDHVVISVTRTPTTMPHYCPSALDFAALRTLLNGQGQDLGHVKIGFHVAVGGNQNGLGDWMRCLDAAGVPFFLKSADSAGQIWEAVQLKAASGVPHELVYRKSHGDGWSFDVPNYDNDPYEEAVFHWNRHRAEFPPELEEYKHLIWIETINEIDKNRSEWLAEFSYHTALIAMEQGFNWSAFGWSSGEPEREHWEGPWMQKYLELAGEHPDRVAIAIHEYSYVQENLDRLYPHLVGRFQMLFDVCDASGIPRPTVLITEFGWVYDDIADSVEQAMEIDLPWAAELYAPHPQVKGAAIWYLGAGFGGVADEAQKLIAPVTEYALQNYFVIPLE